MKRVRVTAWSTDLDGKMHMSDHLFLENYCNSSQLNLLLVSKNGGIKTVYMRRGWTFDSRVHCFGWGVAGLSGDEEKIVPVFQKKILPD